MTKKRKNLCPRCKGIYTEFPALSRKDNETLLCPDCGIAEAMQDFAISQRKHD